MNNYEPVIGIEVHVELNTKTKMFCRCSADYFGKEPNTHTCPICVGLPGALPYINEEAINKCMQIGLALNCSVNEKSLFERKNYFYPDLPKGYQISQYRWPLCVSGWVEIEGREGSRRIRVNRVHQEEDTGKLTHMGNETLIDFNRSGVPLVEIVTEPDFRNSSEVKDYAKMLQQIFRHLGVSNADMERGDMRLEANVSVRPEGQKDLPPYRVELKNINSFRFMVAAIEYEIKRQIEALERGETLRQETRGWNEAKKESYLQRSKEEAHDYRYFPEPDLPELRIKNLESRIKEEIKGKLPREKAEYLVTTYKLSLPTVNTLIRQGTAPLFEEVMGIGKSQGIDAQGTANYIINRKIYPSTPSEQIVNDIQSKTINLISDESELEKLARKAIEENPKAVEDYKKGKESAIQVLIGGVMRLSKGKADAGKVMGIMEKLLR